MLGEQLLQVLLHAVLLKTRIDAEVVARIMEDLVNQDPQRVVGLRRDGPLRFAVLIVDSRTVQGGDIQLRGLYDPPSECTSTDPSALIIRTRVAIGRWAVSRPA